MANIDQTGCSDEFNSSFSSTNSSELLLSPKSNLPGGSLSIVETEPSDQIIMDVPFTTPPQPSTSQAVKSVLRGKDLSLLLKPGDRYVTAQESLYFRENMACTKKTPRKDRNNRTVEKHLERSSPPRI